MRRFSVASGENLVILVPCPRKHCLAGDQDLSGFHQGTRTGHAQMRTLSDKENFLRAIEFRRPEWVPIVFELLGVAEKHGPALGELMLRHPLVFDPERARRAGAVKPCAEPPRERRFTDDWGCEWLEVQRGIIGQVVGHPLVSWSALGDLRIADPEKQWDWEAVRKNAEEQRARGELVNGYDRVFKDVEHSSEMSADTSVMVALAYGDPLYFERFLETTRTTEQVHTAVNDRGHRHYKAMKMSATEVSDEPRHSVDAQYCGRAMRLLPAH